MSGGIELLSAEDLQLFKCKEEYGEALKKHRKDINTKSFNVNSNYFVSKDIVKGDGWYLLLIRAVLVIGIVVAKKYLTQKEIIKLCDNILAKAMSSISGNNFDISALIQNTKYISTDKSNLKTLEHIVKELISDEDIQVIIFGITKSTDNNNRALFVNEVNSNITNAFLKSYNKLERKERRQQDADYRKADIQRIVDFDNFTDRFPDILTQNQKISKELEKEEDECLLV